MCSSKMYQQFEMDKHLSWYSFPDGKSKEKKELSKKWINLVSRKDTREPSNCHRVCSEHFIGGRKTYLNNLPLIVPKATRPSISKPRTTSKSRNRSSNGIFKAKTSETKSAPAEETQGKSSINEMQSFGMNSSGKETPSWNESYRSQIVSLQKAINNLKLENERLQQQARFFVHSVKSEDKMF